MQFTLHGAAVADSMATEKGVVPVRFYLYAHRIRFRWCKEHSVKNGFGHAVGCGGRKTL